MICMPCLSLTQQQMQVVQSAAQDARLLCLKAMHHDTDGFVICVDKMLSRDGNTAEHQLGFAYLGLVGCMSAARISTLHSDFCSRDYLQLTDHIAKKLRIKDEEICPVVPGECSVRISQIRDMRSHLFEANSKTLAMRMAHIKLVGPSIKDIRH
jgi:hypothetical protein